MCNLKPWQKWVGHDELILNEAKLELRWPALPWVNPLYRPWLKGYITPVSLQAT